MKLIQTLTILLLSTLCQAQQLEVFIFGTTHAFNEDHIELQDFEKAQKALVNFDPDIFCIESIPSTDTASLKEIWPNTMKRADKLSLRLENGLADSIDNPDLLKAANFYTQYDIWNAWYYWNTELVKGNSIEPFSKYNRKVTNSEFGRIVFPAARTLEVDQFYAVDYRAGESEFLANNNKVLKQLLFRFKWGTLKSYLKVRKQYKKSEKNGQLIEFINGPVFQNSFSDLIDVLPVKLPKTPEAQEVQDYWLNRNKIMADRLIQRASENNAKRIVLTVGSAHVGHIQKFLEAQGHTVYTYSEILEQQKNK